MYWVISIDYINENPYATWDRYQPTLPLSFKESEWDREGGKGKERKAERRKKRKLVAPGLKTKTVKAALVSVQDHTSPTFSCRGFKTGHTFYQGVCFNWILSLGFPMCFFLPFFLFLSFFLSFFFTIDFELLLWLWHRWWYKWNLCSDICPQIGIILG